MDSAYNFQYLFLLFSEIVCKFAVHVPLRLTFSSVHFYPSPNLSRGRLAIKPSLQEDVLLYRCSHNILHLPPCTEFCASHTWSCLIGTREATRFALFLLCLQPEAEFPGENTALWVLFVHTNPLSLLPRRVGHDPVELDFGIFVQSPCYLAASVSIFNTDENHSRTSVV